ncbi:GGDEF domain-containing protein [Actinoplanes sp. GCM10030250]|uniref:GGDEF domain-containing protein n=1 Tax=Actinoplanes sp. GCM10030250 TaxID=3273376 RepID=UPI0036190FBD
MDTPRTSRTGHRHVLVPLVFLLVVAVFTFGHITGTAPVRLTLLFASGVVAAIAVAVGIRVNRVTDRRPWRLVIGALTLLSICNGLWTLPVVLDTGWSRPPDLLVAPPQIGGYALLLAASLMIVLRHAPKDGSGTIDAAVWGIAVAAPVWEFLFRPRLLDAHAGTGQQLIVLTQILVLFGICGSLLRVARTCGAGRACLAFLFAALGCTVVGIATVNALPSAAEHQATVPALCFALGYLCLGAAAMHPSVIVLMEPSAPQVSRSPRLQLKMFGTAILVVPLVGAIGQVVGVPPDGLLLTLAPMLTVPLVMIRISRLSAQRARDQQALAHQAAHDELTGLINRRRLFQVMEEAITRHAAGRAGELALIYCDLNDFKPINDGYGHEAGDEVLRSTAARINAVVRTKDVVARIGGDEFLIFCPDTDEASAYALGDRIAEAVAAPLPWRGHTLRVTAAVGATLWTERRQVAPDVLLAAADDRMYANKRARKVARTA